MSESLPPPPTGPVTSVLLVDDSVVVRGLLRQIIMRHPGFAIAASAANGRQGVDEYRKTRPDIVLMDIEMPEKDGLTALREILAFDPGARVIMCSSLTQSGAQASVDALQAGAVDCLAKPSSHTVDRGDLFEDRLMRALRALAKTATGGHAAAKASAVPAPQSAPDESRITLTPYPPLLPHNFPLALAIGSSTGGPKALLDVLKGLDKNIAAPIFITQHIPDGFSRFLADNIGKSTGFITHEAQQDMPIENGHVYLAPGGMHMGVKPGTPRRIELLDLPPVNFCKPSVDVMLDNLAAQYGAGLLTVILTGMGADGKKAAEENARASPYNIVIAQDKATSVVWGMPGAIAQTGVCHAVLPLHDIPRALNSLLRRTIPV